ncbi:MAG: hypothetical protein RBG13Loki_3779 [Promethearchaeota archaeon CR_4]|nr:MAG: hypothetical protein RBG13Loki_3779 [Candidatus Lokiarchaeota archaeon CR_4]
MLLVKSKMTQSRAERQWQKFEEEERHFQYLVAKGYTSATIADVLIHNLLDAMKIGIKNQHPEYTDKQVFLKQREIINEDKDLKKPSRGKRNGGV